MSNLTPAQQQAMADLEKGISDLVLGMIGAATAGGNYQAIVGALSPVLTDAIKILAEVSSIPGADVLQPEDYEMAVAAILSNIVLPPSLGKGAVVAAPCLKLAKDLALVIMPDLLAIIAAAKS